MIIASRILVAVIAARTASAITFTVPAAPPLDAAELDPAPVGISYEFFAYPSYRKNVSATLQCETNLKNLSGTWPAIRLGGTTQDRATYDPNSDAYVVYTVADPTDAPANLTYGTAYMTLAADYGGRVTLGLNRGRNNLSNTVLAAQFATENMPNLFAIELGNEPEYYPNDGQPIADGGWNASVDAQSQANWQIWVGEAIGETAVFEAGNSLMDPPEWGAAELIEAQNETALSFVKTFSHHDYPGGSVESLMSHVNVVDNVAKYETDIEAAREIGREYVFGETNSATGGGAADISPSFGAALWVADYSLRAVSQNVSRLYFHHGTVGACQYCWWGRYDMGSPYYGAYFAADALAGGDSIAPIDVGNSSYSAYAVFDEVGSPIKVALYNSDYYDGDGTRGSEVFSLTGIQSTSVTAKRLTAASALSRVDRGQNPTYAGMTFENGTCLLQGTEAVETVSVEDGGASFTLAASEALLVFL
ncbi:glycoside hydrolase family 79 protein [Saccharata proteae CBS 121410]|uniref:Glycoside hydrolase family 79 protein n=1 Tax=Saccharata proteae CBS 121410 TaxID=1314787 RepID=A0A6A5YDP8_9PEZI|nr:glycoside hydrolase family 79 protein [Saccharata proteae CBS 121410]